jgi:hypothetical protein
MCGTCTKSSGHSGQTACACMTAEGPLARKSRASRSCCDLRHHKNVLKQQFSLRSILILSSYLNLVLLFPSVSPTKNVVRISNLPLCATCPAHLIFLDLIILIYGEEYKLWRPSLRSLLQPPVTSSLLGPNLLLSTLFSKTVPQSKHTTSPLQRSTG